jgi:Flp pilus assembly secretin CpaC
MRAAKSIAAFTIVIFAAAMCREESETVVNGGRLPCISLSGLTPRSATVAVGDSTRFSLHPDVSAECAHVSRAISWSVGDSSTARMGTFSDTSIFVIGKAPGETTLIAQAVADVSARAVSTIVVIAR